MSAAPGPDFEPAIAGLPPKIASLWGFRSGARGTHTSRTIMLDELSRLLAAVPGEASRRSYAEAIVDGNCLGKRTAATRKLSLQRLTELYGLDARFLLFRAMRSLWGAHEASRPRLALLLALARDPLLRASARPVAATPIGREFERRSMRDALSGLAEGRLNDATLDKVVRNASSSWTRSGHLRGRERKIRQRVEATPAAAAYALLLGFATGRRGGLLFETPWAAVLDAPPGALVEIAVDARRLGWIDLKRSGRMIEVSFPAMLTRKERERVDGAHRGSG